MTRDEALKRLRELQGSDPESGHYEADQILLSLIGDVEIENAYRAIGKWYA